MLPTGLTLLIAQLTPLIRYVLIGFSTFMVTKGIYTQEVADEFARDPVIIELVVGLVTAAITLIWYWWSQSRQALRDFLNRVT